VKLAKIGHVRDIEDVIRGIQSGSATPAAGSPPADRISRPPSPPAQRPVEAPPAAKQEEPAEKPPREITFADIFSRRVDDRSETAAIYLHKADRIERTENGVSVILSSNAALAMLQSNENKSLLDSVASELVGKPVSVSLIMKEPSTPAITSVESAKDEPLVKKFLEVFRGDLAQVKPAKGE
jgi:hypothetical protein